ncbi:MAG: YdcF family protein [Bacteroidota bacterium]
MFFIISKILYFIMSPIVWVIALLTYSIFGSNIKYKKRTLIWSLVILLFFSNTFIFEEFMRLLEVPGKKYEEIDNYDYAIVLGGMIFYDSGLKQIVPMRGIDRLIKTMKLYKLGKVKKIFISGGSGSLQYIDFKEADIIKKYLIDIGIPEEDILCEVKSRNTYENAVFTKEALKNEIGNKKFLLITSAYHMRRAKACFDKIGINTDIFPADRYAGPRLYKFDQLFIPDVNVFSEWIIFFKEIIGYFAYKMAGYV